MTQLTYHQQKAAHLRRNASNLRERWPDYPNLARTLEEWAEWHEEEAQRLKTEKPEDK